MEVVALGLPPRLEGGGTASVTTPPATPATPAADVAVAPYAPSWDPSGRPIVAMTERMAAGRCEYEDLRAGEDACIAGATGPTSAVEAQRQLRVLLVTDPQRRAFEFDVYRQRLVA